ncbi:MAG: hypothetical protein ACHRXM_30505 [Isosphaerales bacterium]
MLCRLAGRSLSVTEILAGIGGVATIVAAFTWAFGSDPQEEATRTGDDGTDHEKRAIIDHLEGAI